MNLFFKWNKFKKIQAWTICSSCAQCIGQYYPSVSGRIIFNQPGLDYGLYIPVSEDVNTFVAISWRGLTIPFGKKSNKD